MQVIRSFENLNIEAKRSDVLRLTGAVIQTVGDFHIAFIQRTVVNSVVFYDKPAKSLHRVGMTAASSHDLALAKYVLWLGSPEGLHYLHTLIREKMAGGSLGYHYREETDIPDKDSPQVFKYNVSTTSFTVYDCDSLMGARLAALWMLENFEKGITA